MTDIKETIQGLYALKTYLASKAIEEHGPARESLIGIQKVVDSAVNLLKEQETVRPKKIKGYNPPMYTLYEYECEKCESPMMNKQPFCMGCGQAVKWDE